MSGEILTYLLLIGVPVICFTIYEIVDRVCESKEKRKLYENKEK